MPSQWKDVCGMTFVSFHEGFCVTNHFEPAARTICGSAPV